MTKYENQTRTIHGNTKCDDCGAKAGKSNKIFIRYSPYYTGRKCDDCRYEAAR